MQLLSRSDLFESVVGIAFKMFFAKKYIKIILFYF